VTVNGARALELDGYGLEPGCHADMVVLQATDTVDALRTRPARLQVIRRGKVIASTPKTVATLVLGKQEIAVDFSLEEKP
jgi:cytosine deaminase